MPLNTHFTLSVAEAGGTDSRSGLPTDEEAVQGLENTPISEFDKVEEARKVEKGAEMSTEEIPEDSGTTTLSAVFSGIAGEYFVAAELTRHGYIASLTQRNTNGVDILVANLEATKSVGVQVKTKKGTGKKWLVGAKAEDRASENLFFVFVNLNDGREPSYHVVPSRVVAERIDANHKSFLARGGKENPMRTFILKNPMEFEDAWDSLGLKSHASTL